MIVVSDTENTPHHSFNNFMGTCQVLTIRPRDFIQGEKHYLHSSVYTCMCHIKKLLSGIRYISPPMFIIPMEAHAGVACFSHDENVSISC